METHGPEDLITLERKKSILPNLTNFLTKAPNEESFFVQMAVFLDRRISSCTKLTNTSEISDELMGSLLSFYCHFFATQIKGGAKELVVLM